MTTDPIASIPLEAFVAAVRTKIFTEDEIAYWVRSNNHLNAGQKLELTKAVADYAGAPPITGILRTALRELEGLLLTA